MQRDATVQRERARAREAMLNGADNESPGARWCRGAEWPQKQEYQRRSDMSARRTSRKAQILFGRFSGFSVLFKAGKVLMEAQEVLPML
jgi:hypothetical protein